MTCYLRQLCICLCWLQPCTKQSFPQKLTLPLQEPPHFLILPTSPQLKQRLSAPSAARRPSSSTSCSTGSSIGSQPRFSSARLGVPSSMRTARAKSSCAARRSSLQHCLEITGPWSTATPLYNRPANTFARPEHSSSRPPSPSPAGGSNGPSKRMLLSLSLPCQMYLRSQR